MKEIDNRLLEAAAKGDLEGVKDALKNGAYINTRDEKGNMPAIHAASGGFVEVVSWLAENKADLTLKNDNYFTAKTMAVIGGYADVVKVLDNYLKTYSEDDLVVRLNNLMKNRGW